MNKPPHLRQWLEDRGQRSDVLAREINMTPATFSRRLKGDGAFHLSEAHKICQFLGQNYATLFPAHSGIDPRDLEAVKHAALVGAA
jgi:transcriptional regulator with XRE-family HTH domain